MLTGSARRRLLVELVRKIVHMIITARVFSGPADLRRISKSFNLDTVEIESAQDIIASIDFSDERIVPLHIDICTSSNEDPTVVLLERWSLSVEQWSGLRMNSDHESAFNPAHMFQRVLILLRSIYSLLRVLPAHALFHFGRSALSRLDPLPFAMFYFIASGPPDPIRRFDVVHVKNFVFAPVDTGDMGTVHISVFYRTRFRYSSSLPTPNISGSKIFPDYISATPSPKHHSTAVAIRTIAGETNSVVESSLPFAQAGASSDSRSKVSLETGPVFGTISALNATPPLIQAPITINMDRHPSNAMKFLIDSPHRDLPPLSSLPLKPSSLPETTPSSLPVEALLANHTFPLSECDDGLEFARCEAGDDHAQIGALLSIIQKAPSRLQSLEPVLLKNILESLEESLTANRSIPESP